MVKSSCIHGIVFFHNFVEVPSIPNQLTAYYLVQSSSSRVLSVIWRAPDNVERFDLEYYRVQALISESDKSYLLNGTTTELEYNIIFDPDSVSSTSSIHIMVTAVSKCGQHSPISKIILPEIAAEPEFQSNSASKSGSYGINTQCHMVDYLCNLS